MNVSGGVQKKGSKWSCVTMVVLFAAIGATEYRLLQAVPYPFRQALSGISALLLSLGLMSFWALLAGYGRGTLSRTAMLRRAHNDEPPVDGNTTVVTGKVRALGAPLTAPISGTPCVLYVYRMYYRTVETRQGGRSEVPVYFGYAARPFALDSRAATYRVLAVPRPTKGEKLLSGEEAAQRARAFVTATQFEGAAANMLGSAAMVFDFAKDTFTDDDGEVHRHWERHGDARDPAELHLEETVLPVGSEASAIGTWSAQKNALVSQESPLGRLGVSAVAGPPENLTSTDGLPNSVASYVATAIVNTVLGTGILWFAWKYLSGR